LSFYNKIKTFVNYSKDFTEYEASFGIILILAAIAASIAKNASILSDFYNSLFKINLGLYL